MPVFEVTVLVIESVQHVAYVEAADQAVADEWGATVALDGCDAREAHRDVARIVERIEPVRVVPRGRTVNVAEAGDVVGADD